MTACLIGRANNHTAPQPTNPNAHARSTANVHHPCCSDVVVHHRNQSLMAEANKLGLLRAAGAGGVEAAAVPPLVTKVRALAEGEGPAKR